MAGWMCRLRGVPLWGDSFYSHPSCLSSVLNRKTSMYTQLCVLYEHTFQLAAHPAHFSISPNLGLGARNQLGSEPARFGTPCSGLRNGKLPAASPAQHVPRPPPCLLHLLRPFTQPGPGTEWFDSHTGILGKVSLSRPSRSASNHPFLANKPIEWRRCASVQDRVSLRDLVCQVGQECCTVKSKSFG